MLKNCEIVQLIFHSILQVLMQILHNLSNLNEYCEALLFAPICAVGKHKEHFRPDPLLFLVEIWIESMQILPFESTLCCSLPSPLRRTITLPFCRFSCVSAFCRFSWVSAFCWFSCVSAFCRFFLHLYILRIFLRFCILQSFLRLCI